MLTNQCAYPPYIWVIELEYVLCNNAVDIVFFGVDIVILKQGSYYHIGPTLEFELGWLKSLYEIGFVP